MAHFEENIKTKINKSFDLLNTLHQNSYENDFISYQLNHIPDPANLLSNFKLNPTHTYYNKHFLTLFGGKATLFQLLFINYDTIVRLFEQLHIQQHLSIHYLFADLCYQIGSLLYSYSLIYQKSDNKRIPPIFQTLFKFFFRNAGHFYQQADPNHDIANYKFFLFFTETFSYQTFSIHKDKTFFQKFTGSIKSLLSNPEHYHCKYLFYSFLSKIYILINIKYN